MHITSPDDVKPCPHVDRYQMGLMDRLTGVQFSIGGTTETIRMEATGSICSELRAKINADGSNMLDTIIKSANQNCTRADICSDLNYPVPPAWIVEMRGISRIRRETHEISETGWTYYIGSRKSDRCCRIYLYESPHPRCLSTRIEYQCRDSYGETFRESYRSGVSLEVVFRQLSNSFALILAQSLSDSEDYGKFKAHSEKPVNPDKLRWVWNTAFPALVSFVDESDFNIEAFKDAIISEVSNRRAKSL